MGGERRAAKMIKYNGFRCVKLNGKEAEEGRQGGGGKHAETSTND